MMDLRKSYYMKNLTTKSKGLALFGAAILVAFLFLTGSALAVPNNLGVMHMPVNSAQGAVGGTTNLSIFLRTGSPDNSWAAVGTAPTSSGFIWPQIFYKNIMTGGDANFIATSTCVHLGMGFHQCTVPAYASTTNRRGGVF
jgi:hypothetical protein